MYYKIQQVICIHAIILLYFEKKITDEDYLNTYSFLFTGKYQEDMAEISHTDPQYLYDIKDIFTQNVI